MTKPMITPIAPDTAALPHGIWFILNVSLFMPVQTDEDY
jgi:hypothetical protein